MEELSPKQALVLSALKRAPPHALPVDLAKELGIHLTTLQQHIKVLAKKGYVSYTSQGIGRSPLIRVIEETRGVPLIGDIPAGPLSEAIEHPEGYLPFKMRAGRFALRVQGDSMADLIQSGDVVLLDKEVLPKPGDICALRIDHCEVTLKYLEWRGQRPKLYTLRPHNPAYPTEKVKADELVIEGVFFSLIRGGLVHELLLEESM